jgi:hypothetical protein
MPDDPRAPAALERRIALLEAAVRGLASELDTLRNSVPSAKSTTTSAPPSASQPSSPQPPSFQPSPSPASSWIPQQIDFESLIGRYGTLVLATVSALAAVGLFLGWAIEKGWLGPPQRIGLGLLTAAGLAVGGLRLRRHERSFGATLLGLSLAVTHVCAWGAGPSLQLVPHWVAFLLAALASIVLAVFAYFEDDEPLWSVGFSGAAVAPFVTASGKANLPLLTLYGIAVMVTAGWAMGPRRWMVGARLFQLAAAAYTVVLATGFEADYGPLLAMAFPLAVALLGVIPWVDGWRRRERVRTLGAMAAAAALRAAFGTHLPLESRTVAGMIAAAGILWLAMVDFTYRVSEQVTTPLRRLYEGDWLDAAVLPLAYVLAAAIAWDASERESGIGMAVAGVVLMITVTRYPVSSLRDSAVFATVLSALVATLLLLKGHTLQITIAIAALSAACFLANLQWRSVAWTTLGAIGFAWAVLATTGHLTARLAYGYTPFWTSETGVALAVLAAILVGWRCARDPRIEQVLRYGSLAWVFVWVHQELLFAISVTVSTLLLVAYYATTSVAAVWLGRSRRIAGLRHVGLGLALVAAVTALYGARNLVIGAKIGADLLAAVFLLAIAYWYRRPGGTSGHPERSEGSAVRTTDPSLRSG